MSDRLARARKGDELNCGHERQWLIADSRDSDPFCVLCALAAERARCLELSEQFASERETRQALVRRELRTALVSASIDNHEELQIQLAAAESRIAELTRFLDKRDEEADELLETVARLTRERDALTAELQAAREQHDEEIYDLDDWFDEYDLADDYLEDE